MTACEYIEFDKENKQEDYLYAARSIETGEYVVGYIVVDKPWYSNENEWTYYIIENNYYYENYDNTIIADSKYKYSSSRYKYTIVNKDTIEPYTQITQIKINQSQNITTELIIDKKEKEFDYFMEECDFREEHRNGNVIEVTPNDKIPYYLYEMK